MRTKHYVYILYALIAFGLFSCDADKPKAQLNISQAEIKADVLKADLKIAVSKAEASVEDANHPIGNSIDGDLTSMYFSGKLTKKDAFPVTLTYHFDKVEEIEYTKFFSRDKGYEGNWVVFDVYAKSAGKEEQKIGSYNQHETYVDNIKLNLQKPEYVKFVVSSAYSGAVNTAEVQFYAKNPVNAVPEVFTDASCSVLKNGVTDAQIEAIESEVLKKVAKALKEKTYDADYRVTAYDAILSPKEASRKVKIGNGFSQYQNLTGMYLEEGQHIILVGPTGGKDISLMLPNWMRQPTEGFKPTEDPKGWGLHRTIEKLREGVNVVNVPYSTNAYIHYFDDQPESSSAITIHFPTGKVNKYFDPKIHTNEDWKVLLDSAASPMMDAVGDFIQVAYPVKYFKQFAYDKGLELMGSYDTMLLSHYTVNGFKKYDLLPTNKILARVNFNYYMFRDGDGVAYLGDENTMRMVVDPAVVTKGDPCWGFAHEVGHVLQMIPQLNWGGLTEVSNNIFSLYTNIGLGTESRLQAQNSYEGGRKTIIDSKPKISYLQDPDVFHRLVPFWQLHLYFTNNGHPDFYADLMQKLRTTDDVGRGNESINNQFEFIKIACDLTETDLTDFFDKWGFFYVGKIDLEDYGKYSFTITKKQVDDTRGYVASKNYKKPVVDITTIDDNTYSAK